MELGTVDVWQQLEGRLRTEEDRRALSVVSMTLASLRSFLTILEGKRGRTPRAILDELTNLRVSLSQVPETVTTDLRRYMDGQEQELYELILPEDLRQRAVDSIECEGQPWQHIIRRCLEASGGSDDALSKVLTPEGRQKFRQAYLEQLRVQLSDPHVQATLDEVLGKKAMRGRRKSEGASSKNWPLVGEVVWTIYQLLWPLYTRSSANQPQSISGLMQDDPPAYPQSLLEDMATLLKTEFPEFLSDLTATDVLSRVQYRHHR